MINFLFRAIRKFGLLDKIADYTMQKAKNIEEWEYNLLIQTHAVIEKDVLLIRKPLIENNQANPSRILIKRGSVLNDCQLLIFKHGGEITVGEDSFIGPQSRIWSASKISIGNRVLISHNVNIHDNNSHDLNANKRHEEFLKIFKTGLPENANYNEKPIVIEDDVWIGFNSTIAKGVTIGKGAIIGHNSFVKSDVPSFAIMAGNPAVQIGTSN